MLQLTPFALDMLAEHTAAMGAIYGLILQGRLKAYLKKSDAFRLYGRNAVEHWITEGLITPRKDGGHSACWRIERLELEAAARAHQLRYYI